MSGGFGMGPYGLDSFGVPSVGPTDEPPITLVSSREIDFATGRYSIDSDGNYTGMQNTASRVSLLATIATARDPKIIDERYRYTCEQNIRAALKPLTAKPAVIEILSIEVTNQAQGKVVRRVNFRDLLNGEKQSVTV